VRLALRNRLSAIAIAAAATATFAQPAFADSAFVAQATKGSFFDRPAIASPVAGQSAPFFTPPPRGGVTQQTPETTVPATGGNFARTLEMGNNNFVFQSQSGVGNFSNVGIFGGVHDDVGVFQKGQGLSSNLFLVGVKGISLDVVQVPGAPPVNAALVKMPNGTFELFGVSAANVFRAPSGLVVIK
jgi:hypothetical protein